MSDKVVAEFYFQCLYELMIDKVFTFTIGKERKSAREFYNYLSSNYCTDNLTLKEKALQTRLNVSHETLRGNYEFKL